MDGVCESKITVGVKLGCLRDKHLALIVLIVAC